MDYIIWGFLLGMGGMLWLLVLASIRQHETESEANPPNPSV